MKFRLTKKVPGSGDSYRDYSANDAFEALAETGMICTGSHQRFIVGCRGETSHSLFLKDANGEIYELNRFYEILIWSES